MSATLLGLARASSGRGVGEEGVVDRDRTTVGFGGFAGDGQAEAAAAGASVAGFVGAPEPVEDVGEAALPTRSAPPHAGGAVASGTAWAWALHAGISVVRVGRAAAPPRKRFIAVSGCEEMDRARQRKVSEHL